MSLEQSMTTLAEANLKLAAAMDNYANVMSKHAAIQAANIGVKITADEPVTTPAAAATTEEKPKATRRTKAQIAEDAKKEADALAAEAGGEVVDMAADPFGEEAGGEDPFGDEEPAAPKLDAETIRGLVMRVKEKNPAHALGLLKHIGVSTLSRIEEKDYPKVVELAAKVGVTL